MHKSELSKLQECPFLANRNISHIHIHQFASMKSSPIVASKDWSFKRIFLSNCHDYKLSKLFCHWINSSCNKGPKILRYSVIWLGCIDILANWSVLRTPTPTKIVNLGHTAHLLKESIYRTLNPLKDVEFFSDQKLYHLVNHHRL